MDTDNLHPSAFSYTFYLLPSAFCLLPENYGTSCPILAVQIANQSC